MAISFTGNWDADSFAGGDFSITFTNVTPASGDLLVLIVGVAGSGFDLSAGLSGWTKAVDSDAANAAETSSHIYYKISDGTETGVSYNGTAGNMTAAVLQFTGAAASSTLDATGFDDSEEAVGDQTAYSGAASSTADGVAVALMTFKDQRFAEDGTNSLSNSFSKVVDIDPSNYGGSSNYPNPVTGYLVYTGSASRSCTATTTDSGDENAGCIALFKAATGAATVTLSSPTATATGPTTATVGCTVTYT